MRWRDCACWRSFAAEPLGFLVGLWMFVASYAIGAAILSRYGLDTAAPAARIALAAGTGLGLLAVVLIPIGLAGLYGPVTSAVLLLAPLLAFPSRAGELGGEIRRLFQSWTETEALRSPLAGVVVAVAPAFLAAYLLCMLAPSIAYDAVSHHLPAAKYYVMSGKLQPLPMIDAAFDRLGVFTLGHSVAYSYYPQSFEELLAVAWSLGGQPAAQFVTPLFFILSLLTGAAIAGLCGVSRLGCVLGLAVGATLPVASWTGAIAKNDWPLAFFQLAALYAVLRALEGEDGRPRGWLLLTAFFLGLSFGVKHVALFGAIPIGLLALNALRRQPRFLRLAASMALIFALSGLFWHARAYILKGNPVYPAGARLAARSLGGMDGTAVSRPLAYLVYPWYAHFKGHSVLESPSSNPLGFSLLFFAAVFLLVVRRKASSPERRCWFYLAVYYLYWVYVWGVLRYALAPMLVLSLLLGGRMAGLSMQTWPRRISVAALAYSLCFALLPTMIIEVNAPQLAYFAGRLDKAGYLREAMVDYPVIEFLNERVKATDRVIAINDCSSVYAWDPARFRCIRVPNRYSDHWFDDIAGLIAEAQPDYLVLPVGDYGDRISAGLPSGAYPEEIFRDSTFRALR